MRKLIIAAFCFLLLGTVLSACSGKTDKTVAKHEISVRIAADPDFLDPHKAQASLTFMMMLNIYEGLVNPMPDGGVTPAVAKKYSVSKDGLTYTFTLRDGIKFHNGDPVTVDDVKYSFDRLMGTTTGKPLSSKFVNVASIETPDEKTVVMKLKTPDSTFLTRLTANDAAILSKKNDAKQNDHPIGTGPFKFVKYAPQNNLIVEKFKDYWRKGVPYFDKVTFVFQEDDQAAYLSLEGGDLQLASIPASKVSEAEGKYTLIHQNTNAVFLLGFNEKKKPFNDRRIRQAINDAINKDDIIQATFSGRATKIGSNMSPAMGSYYKKGLEDYYKTDLNKAKSLLAEAGFKDGFSTTLTVSSHNKMYADAAQVVKEELKPLGINVKINVVEWAKWLENVYKNRDYEMTMIDFTGYLSPYQILERYRTDASGNLMNYSNPEYDTLMKDVLLEQDKDKQIQMYRRAQEILTKDAAAVYIADYQSTWAMDKKYTGMTPYPIFYLDMSRIKPKE
ncbi:ABC transporter substrate-binding protein [Camelliibacillus cellulosilyticus]|uniref:ABC transporter substrate-binding protein n=1 Tax=Camelliibacillus cellulosilyticus TaxID=2174486 RepID=A0ABV9GQI6_9BACL